MISNERLRRRGRPCAGAAQHKQIKHHCGENATGLDRWAVADSMFACARESPKGIAMSMYSQLLASALSIDQPSVEEATSGEALSDFLRCRGRMQNQGITMVQRRHMERLPIIWLTMPHSSSWPGSWVSHVTPRKMTCRRGLEFGWRRISP